MGAPAPTARMRRAPRSRLPALAMLRPRSGRLAGEDAGGLAEQGLALDHVVGAVEHRLHGAAVDPLGERVLGGGPVVQLVGGLLADALALGRGEEAGEQ